MGKLFGEGEGRRTITASVLAAIIITLTFILVEFISTRAGLFRVNLIRYLIDSGYRIIAGIIATTALFSLCRRNHRDFYFGKIPKVTWLLLIPVYVYFLSYIDVVLRTESVNFAYILSFLACVLQQITTGFFEETLYRGVVMEPFRPHFSEKKWRLAAVITSGVVFGFAHSLNFIFSGADVLGNLEAVFMTMIWGMFIASIYIVCDNLLLVMVVHAIWDIWIRIPEFFFNPVPGSFLHSVIGDYVRLFIHPIILGIFAIYICSLKGDICYGTDQSEEEEMSA